MTTTKAWSYNTIAAALLGKGGDPDAPNVSLSERRQHPASLFLAVNDRDEDELVKNLLWWIAKLVVLSERRMGRVLAEAARRREDEEEERREECL